MMMNKYELLTTYAYIYLVTQQQEQQIQSDDGLIVDGANALQLSPNLGGGYLPRSLAAARQKLLAKAGDLFGANSFGASDPTTKEFANLLESFEGWERKGMERRWKEASKDAYKRKQVLQRLQDMKLDQLLEKCVHLDDKSISIYGVHSVYSPGQKQQAREYFFSLRENIMARKERQKFLGALQARASDAEFRGWLQKTSTKPEEEFPRLVKNWVSYVFLKEFDEVFTEKDRANVAKKLKEKHPLIEDALLELAKARDFARQDSPTTEAQKKEFAKLLESLEYSDKQKGQAQEHFRSLDNKIKERQKFLGALQALASDMVFWGELQKTSTKPAEEFPHLVENWVDYVFRKELGGLLNKEKLTKKHPLIQDALLEMRSSRKMDEKRVKFSAQVTQAEGSDQEVGEGLSKGE